MSIEISCEKCGAKSITKAAKTYFGYHKVKCPDCGVISKYPLGNFYRTLWYTAFILSIVFWIYIFASSLVDYLSAVDFLPPVVVSICSIIAIVTDFQLRKKVEKTPTKEET